MKGDLFQSPLQARRDVALAICKLRARRPRRPERARVLIRKDASDDRRPLIPTHVDALSVMPEVVKVQLEAPIVTRADDVAELRHEARLAIGREAHHLALVTIVRETQELRSGRIDDAGRMRILHLAGNFNAVPFAFPHIVEMKSPNPSIESSAARSNGET